MTKIKQKIESAIKKFSSGSLFDNTITLFDSLGYNTSRQSRLDNPTYKEFEKNFLEQNANIQDTSKFKEKAKIDQWQKIELLFQLTDMEMSSKGYSFDMGEFDNTIINAYLFFAIELKSGNYNRTLFSDITRQINRVFSMPVMLVFKQDNNITLSIIKRRLHKTDKSRDVLEKVTLIKDINTIKPHRAPIEILFDLSLEELKKKHSVSNFVELQKAWQKTLDYSELNKKFYSEIANWYFWAIENIEFPDDLEKNSDLRNATAAIRLLTRLIFVWFIKEKSVIPEALFQKEKLKLILKNFTNPESSDATIFYKVILQNLFFATLSTEKNKRTFRGKKWINGRNIDFGNQYVYRYESLVSDADKWKALFADIPFLNGGLFENLDNKAKKMMVDGFSEEKRNRLNVPDFLFFSPKINIDLNKTFDTKGKKYKVKGLLGILNNYKFTITENTPIEEEIALDPELLGKVFENLLASFNPETKTTARKQTGSFYTPREIVDYMVDESLKVSLSRIVSYKLENTTSEDIKIGLDILFAYTEKEHAFNNKEVKQIVKAVSEIKILDPACGSGAFPMGILHKLVFILTKLDPDNIVWRELQKQKAMKDTENAYNLGKQEERQIRIKEIEETFNSNTSDYGRKLFLIENAIYGMDIQPIAVQIAKLRFFISLIVDQDMKNNIMPLPNLETKFVAADTLIGKRENDLFANLHDSKIGKLENRLKAIRHKYFNARNTWTKENLRKQDTKIRNKLLYLLKQHLKKEAETNIKNNKKNQELSYYKKLVKRKGEKNEYLKKISRLETALLSIKKSYQSINNETSLQLASWYPYDQNSQSIFFDPEWMYGITDGFDIVIGNPPYVQIQKFSGRQIQKDWGNEKYKTFAKTGDIYSLFYEKGNMLLKNGGALAFITSNKWMRANYGKKTRKYLTQYTKPITLIDFSGYKIFESATVDTNILIFQKIKVDANPNKKINPLHACTIGTDFTEQTDIEEYVKENGVTIYALTEDNWIISNKEKFAIKKRIEEVGTPLKEWDVRIVRGIVSGLKNVFEIDEEIKNNLIKTDSKSIELIKPVVHGKEIKKYSTKEIQKYLLFINRGVDIKKYSAVYNYLYNYKNNLSKRATIANHPWYELQQPQEKIYHEFDKKRIIYPDISSNNAFSICDAGIYCDNTTYNINSPSYYLLGLLNSKVSDFYYKFIANSLGSKAVRFFTQYVEQITIPKISKKKQFPFEILVDCILFAKENGMDSESDRIESVIDLMVFDLYFEKEMKEKDCYITDYITQKIQAFKPEDTDEFKKEYIKAFYTFTSKDKDVFRCLKFAHHLVKPVRIIMEQKNG